MIAPSPVSYCVCHGRLQGLNLLVLNTTTARASMSKMTTPLHFNNITFPAPCSRHCCKCTMDRGVEWHSEYITPVSTWFLDEQHGKIQWKEDRVTAATKYRHRPTPLILNTAVILRGRRKTELGSLINDIQNAVVISAFCYADRVEPFEQSSMLPSTESPVYHLEMQ